MDWVRILAYVTETVDQELLARNEYLAAENRVMEAQLKGGPKLSDAERGANSARADPRSDPNCYAESVGFQLLILRHYRRV